MNQKFNVGDQVKVVNQVGQFSYLNGSEGVVIGRERLYFGIEPKTGLPGIDFGYAVRMDDGDYVIQALCLRLKRPPAADTGELMILSLFDAKPTIHPEMVPA